MNKEEMTLEKAEKIVDDMYQKRWEECGIDEGNTIHLGNLDNLKYSELESASIFLLRKEISFRNENTNLKQALNKVRDKLLSYGETFDSEIHQQFQKECLQIINEAVGDDKNG